MCEEPEEKAYSTLIGTIKMKTEPVRTPITGQEEKVLSIPLKAVVDFYKAFNSRDMQRMEDNWAQTDDVSLSSPAGDIKRGWSEVKAVYEYIFNGPATVKVEFYDYTLHESNDIFYVVGRERGEVCTGETRFPLTIRTSRIFRMIDGAWKQVHSHGSMDDAELLARCQSKPTGGQ